jgi:acetyltransferase-like isoleucine patch superfamily enzyme
MPGLKDVRAVLKIRRVRRNMRRLWGDAGRGLLAPPSRAFASFGRGSIIMPPARVQASEHIHIGDGVTIHEHAWLCVVPQPGMPAPRLEIGSGTSINRFFKVVCAGEVIIGEDCLIGDQVAIEDTHYRYDLPDTPIQKQPLADPLPVRIGRGTHIGVRCTILPGVTIGEYAYLGAAAVVREDVPPRTVVAGDPARPIRRYDEARGDWVDVRSRPDDRPE